MGLFLIKIESRGLVKKILLVLTFGIDLYRNLVNIAKIIFFQKIWSIFRLSFTEIWPKWEKTRSNWEKNCLFSENQISFHLNNFSLSVLNINIVSQQLMLCKLIYLKQHIITFLILIVCIITKKWRLIHGKQKLIFLRPSEQIECVKLVLCHFSRPRCIIWIFKTQKMSSFLSGSVKKTTRSIIASSYNGIKRCLASKYPYAVFLINCWRCFPSLAVTWLITAFLVYGSTCST